MIKKIVINVVILVLLLVALVTHRWPNDILDILSTATVIVFSLAGGVAIANLMGVGRNGKKGKK